MNWVQIGKLEDIPRQGSRIVNSAGGEIALFRSVDDQVFALDNRCPHKGGPLAQGIVHGKRVTCPLHNWQIDLESGVAVEPDVGCSRKHHTKVENGVVFIARKVEACGS